MSFKVRRVHRTTKLFDEEGKLRYQIVEDVNELGEVVATRKHFETIVLPQEIANAIRAARNKNRT